ncbi:uncharacterized protein LOC128222419 [Mya arenaria]|uniref:uncharacterized protein LOC128222419 n=1 Tax=Mya arenaria TaxID=6604 RepID=UPI0022E17DCA|nr:uncharacterized protein LOC128222419 [Mya arenaria]
MAKTVFVEGEPGSGKSSLCKKIVHDWCETKQEGQTIYSRTSTKGNEISSQFEFVFYIILREAKKECYVKKMILKNIIERIGIDKRSGEELLGEILKSNTCLLVLDGLDEWQHPEGCHFDERIPHVETSWENCTIFITTRPYKLAEMKVSRFQIGKHVMVKGVSNPEKLVEKIVSSLNDLSGKGPSQDPEGTSSKPNHELCIREIQEKHLWHFSICPIVLAHIVWLWYKGKLSTDMKRSDLYGTLLKERWSESCDKRNSSSRSKYKDIISTLSEIAFAKLFAEDENHTIVFEIDEEKNVTFESQKTASLESGIISRTNVPGESPQYYFLHKTVQEYLAALCISKDILRCCLHIKITYQNQRRESGTSLSKVFHFLCGMNSKAAEELSKTMNELFTDFCDREGYSSMAVKIHQNEIIQGQRELERGDNTGSELCLQHIYIHNFDECVRGEKKATALERYFKTNQSSVISLHIRQGNTKQALHLGKKSDKNVLNLRKFKGLKYLHVDDTSFKDIKGLNFNHLVECSINFRTPQQAPRLTSTFYKSDIKCLNRIKTLELSNLTDLNWLKEGSEREGIIDMRRLANLEHLT